MFINEHKEINNRPTYQVHEIFLSLASQTHTLTPIHNLKYYQHTSHGQFNFSNNAHTNTPIWPVSQRRFLTK